MKIETSEGLDLLRYGFERGSEACINKAQAHNPALGVLLFWIYFVALGVAAYWYHISRQPCRLARCAAPRGEEHRDVAAHADVADVAVAPAA